MTPLVSSPHRAFAVAAALLLGAGSLAGCATVGLTSVPASAPADATRRYRRTSPRTAFVLT